MRTLTRTKRDAASQWTVPYPNTQCKTRRGTTFSEAHSIWQEGFCSAHLRDVDDQAGIGDVGHPDQTLLDNSLPLNLHAGDRCPRRQQQWRWPRAGVLSDVVDLLERHRGGADATLRQQEINVGESMGWEGDKAGDAKKVWSLALVSEWDALPFPNETAGTWHHKRCSYVRPSHCRLESCAKHPSSHVKFLLKGLSVEPVSF